MSATQSSVDVAAAGDTPIATVTQTQSGNTVYVQQSAIVDPNDGTWSKVDGNGLHVVLSVGTPNTSGPISASNIAAGGNATLTSTVPVTSGKTGTLQHALFSSTQPTAWALQTVNNAGTPTNVCTILTAANETFSFKPGSNAEVSTALASTSSCVFQVVATNLSTNQDQTATAYATFFWAEN